MPQVDFYILESSGPRAREMLACKLAEKAFGRGHRIHIRAEDRDQAALLNELLWTFRQGSFLPHALLDQAEGEPIIIGEGAIPPGADDVLINFGPDVPAQYKQFQRIAEVADQQPETLSRARARFRGYRDQGLEPTSHKLES